MKRGGAARVACKPHELEVAGSNPAPASIHGGHTKDVRRNIILAVHEHKNPRNNIEKTSLNWAPFPKRRKFVIYSLFGFLSSVLTTSDRPFFNIQSYGGV